MKFSKEEMKACNHARAILHVIVYFASVSSETELQNVSRCARYYFARNYSRTVAEELRNTYAIGKRRQASRQANDKPFDRFVEYGEELLRQ